MNAVEIGNRIHNARSEKKLTLQDIADDIGVAKSTVQRYEAGTIDNIKLPVIEAIARSIGVNPAWILGKSVQKILPETKKSDWTIQELSKAPLSDGSVPMELKRGIFANNVKKYMLKNNVSHKDICDLLGVDGSTVSQWLDGDELPDIKSIDILADLLHVKRSDLLSAKNTLYYNSEEKNKASATITIAEAWATILRDTFGREPSESEIEWAMSLLKIACQQAREDT